MKRVYQALAVSVVFIGSTVVTTAFMEMKPASHEMNHVVSAAALSKEVTDLNKQIIAQANLVDQDGMVLAASTQSAATIESLPTAAPTTTAAKAKLKTLVQQRRAKLKQLIATDPQQFLANVLPDKEVKKFSDDIKQDLEQRVVISGTLNVIRKDNFQANMSMTETQLITGTGGAPRIRKVHFAENNMHNHNFAVNQVVKVQGIALDDDIVVQEDMPVTNADLAAGDLGIQVVSNPVANGPLPQGTTIPKKVIVFIVNVQNGTNSMSKQQVDAMFNTDANSITNYYSQTSYGGTALTAVVLDPITISNDYNSFTCGSENTYATAAYNQVKDTLPAHDYEMYIMDYVGGRCGYGGFAGGNRLTFVNGVYQVSQMSVITQSINSTMAHELGHNYGMSHSSTGSGIYPDINEYGDNSDVMGAPFYHLPGSNAPHKIEMGWMPTNRVQTISQSGTYTIDALATTDGSDPLVLKIARPNPEATGQYGYYFLSYRAPIGQDTQLDGSYLNKTSIHTFAGHTFLRGVVGDTQSYTDTNNAIMITQTSHTDTTATVNVTIGTAPVCTKVAPTVTVSDSQTGAPGVMKTYTISVTNNNSAVCPSVSFRLAGLSMPTTWTTAWLGVPNAPTVGYSGNTNFGFNLSGGQTQTLTFNVTPPSDIGDGSYDLPFAFYDYSNVGIVTTNYKFNYVVTNGVNTNYTIGIWQSPGGTITPLATTTVNNGNNLALTITPDQNYKGNLYIDNILKLANITTTTPYAINGVTADHVVRASFTQLFSLAVSGNGNGSVTISPNALAYPSGTLVTLNAIPSSNYEFAGWGGDGSGTTNPVQITVTKDMKITASFAQAKVCVDSDHDGIMDYDAVNCPAGKDICVATISSITDKTSILPKATNYTTNVTTNSDLSNISQLSISKTNTAQVQFKDPVNLAKVDATGCFIPVDLDAAVTISDKKVKIDSTNAPEINKAATITFYNITDPNPVVKRDGVVCSSPQCKIINYDTNAHTLTVEVQGFSSYEIQNEGWLPHLYHQLMSHLK